MSLHKIDLTGFKRAELRDQPQPMLIWARLDQLVIDRRYQRSLTGKCRPITTRRGRLIVYLCHVPPEAP